MGLEDSSDDESFTLIDRSDIPTSSHDLISTPLSSSKARWIEVFMGQFASVALCLSGVTSIFLSNLGFGSSLVQNWVAYFMISVVFTSAIAYCPPNPEEDFLQIFKDRGWKYLLLSFIDVGANFFLVMAYQYTSLTSVQLLDCVTIPTSLVLSYIFLGTRYTYFHYTGIFFSLLGVGFLLWADVLAGLVLDGSNPIYGDNLTLIGAALFGISNVCEESLVKKFSPVEYLGFVGFFSCFISAFAALMFVDFSMLSWTWTTILVLLAYGVSKFLFYASIAFLMIKSNSVAINLSVLSAGFYSIVVGVHLFGYEFNALYIISFILLIGGVLTYSFRPTPLKTLDD